MSTEYQFYLAKKEGDILVPANIWLKKEDGKLSPSPIYWCSASFAHGITDNMWNGYDNAKNLDSNFKDVIGYEDGDYSYSWCYKFDSLNEFLGKDDEYYKTIYVRYDILNEYQLTEQLCNFEEYVWEFDYVFEDEEELPDLARKLRGMEKILSPEVYAGLSEKDQSCYIKYFNVNYDSKEYRMHELITIINSLKDFAYGYGVDNDDKYIICQVC